MAVADQVDSLTEELRARGDVVAAYLFGSAARGATQPRDLDVAVMFRLGVDGFDAAVSVQVGLELAVGAPVDVHDFDALPLDLRFRVLDDGVVLVDTEPAERVDREVAAMMAYYDFQPYLERIRQGAIGRLSSEAPRG